MNAGGTPGDDGMEFVERTILDDELDTESAILREAADEFAATDATFRELAVQYDDPVQRAIQIGIARAQRTLGIDE